MAAGFLREEKSTVMSVGVLEGTITKSVFVDLAIPRAQS